jgi:two-component system cell cycle response regulator
MGLAGKYQEKMYFITYIVILISVASLSFKIYLILDEALKQQKKSAYIINLSGRQRMLSQLIVVNVLSHQKNPSAKNASLLEISIIEMRESHQLLINQPSLSIPVKSLYFQPAYLDKKVIHYLSLAEQNLNNSDDVHILNLLKDMSVDILDDLDKVVYEYQKQSQEKTKKQHKLQLAMLLLIFSLLIVKAFLIFMPIRKRLRHYLHLSERDSLTGLYNRRHFLQSLEEEHRRSLRYNTTYSLCMIDIDHFKLINDQHGHPTGDAVLKQVAQAIEKVIRINDQCARIGGEEFSVLLIDTNENEALISAEKIRDKIKNMRISHNQHVIIMTVSIGTSTYVKSPNDLKKLTTKDMIKRADVALYIAKQTGRNKSQKWSHELTDNTIN